MQDIFHFHIVAKNDINPAATGSPSTKLTGVVHTTYGHVDTTSVDLC